MTQAANLSSEIEGDRDPRPVVRLPPEALPGMTIAVGAAILALVLFFVLEGRRDQVPESVAARSRAPAIVSPPPLGLADFNSEPLPYVFLRPIAPSMPAPVVLRPIGGVRNSAAPYERAVPNLSPQGAPFPAGPSLSPLTPDYPPPTNGFASPQIKPDRLLNALIIDGGALVAPAAPGVAAPALANASGPGAAPVTRPKAIANPTMIVPVGSMLSAVLETPIDTARPGMVRAVVSKDARGFDGTRVLVPRGSRLVGEYQADVRTGQNRVLVTWDTLVLPDGTQIELKSPAADALGGSGIPGRVHSYFLARFASALLQSAMSLGTNLAVNSVQDAPVVIAVPAGQAGSSLSQGLFPADGYRPKITVRQGAQIKVFVARDLDFSQVPSATSQAPR